MKKRLTALFAGVLAIALIAGGCGGDDDVEVTTASIDKAQFIKQADAICEDGDDQVEAKFARYLKENKVNEREESQTETDEKATEIAETILIPALRREVKRIKALGAPSGDEEEIDAMLDALEESLDRAEEEPTTALTANLEFFRKPKLLAEEYGLKVCGY